MDRKNSGPYKGPKRRSNNGRKQGPKKNWTPRHEFKEGDTVHCLKTGDTKVTIVGFDGKNAILNDPYEDKPIEVPVRHLMTVDEWIKFKRCSVDNATVAEYYRLMDDPFFCEKVVSRHGYSIQLRSNHGHLTKKNPNVFFSLKTREYIDVKKLISEWKAS